ncbi:TPA: HTH-type transcriptional regulator ArgP [Escherichia coli]
MQMRNFIDYSLLKNLDLVIKQKGFYRAARTLGISQSAISQKIKKLENQCGVQLITRTSPPHLTDYGQKLAGLLYHVNIFEHDVLNLDANKSIVTIPIAVNSDTLATWLIPALCVFLKNPSIRLDIKVDDENKNLKRLLKGEVVGCISSQPQAIIGGLCDYVGSLDYIFCATPEFYSRYFSQGVSKENLLKAPIVSFNHDTDMHHKFLQQYFGLVPGTLQSHIVSSSEAYVTMLLQHLACCMIPKQQISFELASGKIINLSPEFEQKVKLYWHRYSPESITMQALSSALINNNILI